MSVARPRRVCALPVSSSGSFTRESRHDKIHRFLQSTKRSYSENLAKRGIGFKDGMRCIRTKNAARPAMTRRWPEPL